ncbi:hypothetical protein [Flagellimonas sp.]|uniref:hypothetical protein n=1 Tax=Flagellimonas sp. TaxID=2058762 RepID=UPI003B5BD0F8
MKTVFTITSLLFLIISCRNSVEKKDSTESGEHVSYNSWSISSVNDWATNAGLLNIESIAYDKGQEVFYASNGLNYKPGTDGFISKLSKDGSLLELKWITGLNRPTGMAIRDSILYVADVNSLVLINTKNGRIVKRLMEPVANSGLNDVAINKKGEVYVSASFVHSILKLDREKLEVWLKDEEKLTWANGLIAEDTKLIVAGLHLSSVDTSSKQTSRIELNPIIKDFDGITPDGLGGYFLTTVENSGLFYFDEQKNVYNLMQNDTYFGDIEFNPYNKRLYCPRGKKATGDFFITEFSMKEQFQTKNKHQ